jgi:hypothetical protein
MFVSQNSAAKKKAKKRKEHKYFEKKNLKDFVF